MIDTATGGSASLQIIVKHLLDKAIALAALIVGLPVGLGISFCILLDDGAPVFFIQQRLGRNGKSFPMVKFRSMGVNCAVVYQADGSTSVVEGDLRVTKVGQFLRRTSLDELPQLVNVLLGHMSLVGPRPDLPEHYDLYSEADRGKLRMRPGITGLAQVSGRNDLPWRERIRLDNEYIDNYSLWLDLQILLRTVAVVFAGRGVTAKHKS